MRKLLLATVAVLGASIGVASVADAQTASPAPGTVTVRLNGRYRFYGFIANDKDADNNTGGLTAAGGTNKQSNYGFANYARLFPGFDGVAANGLKYGASLEIRQDQVASAGGGSAGSITGQNRARSGLYFRREWGYLGTNELGTIRLGGTDQPSSLYMTGNFENFNDGGLNGDVPGLITGNLQVTWPFADVGNLYTTTKAVYLSPQFYGFDMGVSYEPSTANFSINNNCPGGISAPGCDRLGSSPNNAESGRRKNTVDALLRYRGTFGGFGIAATGGYIGSSNVKDNQNGTPFNSSRSNGLAVRDNYDGLSVGDFGVALSYAGFSVGGKYQFGRFNNQWSLAPKGVADGEAWLVGASYTIGPVVVGAHYLKYKSAGDIGNALLGRQRSEQGFAAGGTYSLAPGVSVFLSYLFNERKQNGYNFITGAGVTTGNAAGTATANKVSSNLIAIGTSFSW